MNWKDLIRSFLGLPTEEDFKFAQKVVDMDAAEEEKVEVMKDQNRERQ